VTTFGANRGGRFSCQPSNHGLPREERKWLCKPYARVHSSHQILLPHYEQGLFVRSPHHQVSCVHQELSVTSSIAQLYDIPEADSDPEFTAGTIIYADDSPRKNRRSRSGARPQSRYVKRTRRYEFSDDSRPNAQRSKGST